MIVTVVPVYQAIRSLERKHVVLSKQIRTLVVIFTVFTGCYLAVTVFAFTFNNKQESFLNLLLGSTLDLVVDFTPFLLMFCFHLHEVKRAMAEQEQQLRATGTTSELRTTQTASMISMNTSVISVNSLGCLVKPEIGYQTTPVFTPDTNDESEAGI